MSFLSYLLAMTAAFVDRWFPKYLKWKRTSKKELEEVDKKILDALPCVKERRFVSVGNEKLWSISCNQQNTGTPILMIHGMGGGVGLWAMNLEDLSRHRPVYAFDLLGFGRSSRPTFSDNPLETENQFVESIEGYRKAVGLDKFILLGHSLGGFLSAAYALRYPQHVKHLILVDAWGMAAMPAQGARQLPWYIKGIVKVVNLGYPMSLVRGLGPFGPRFVKLYRPGLAEIFGSKLGDETLLHQYIYHCNAQKPSGEAGFKSLTSVHLGWAKEPMIQRFIDGLDPAVPVTFIYGARSWVDRSTGWTVQKSRDSYVDVQVIRAAGHHVYADRWSLFNTLVNNIADSVDSNIKPSFDSEVTKRIHGAPSCLNFQDPTPDEADMQRPIGYVDENLDAGKE